MPDMCRIVVNWVSSTENTAAQVKDGITGDEFFQT
jgi:hypothetical protein